MQSVHGAPPSDALYFPAAHATHPTPGMTEHCVFKVTNFCSSVDTVCISLSVRCESHIMSCAKSQALFWFELQLMHICFVLSRIMFCVLSAIVAPYHSDTSPSDRVLVPIDWLSASTLCGTTPPFLLHMTSQFMFMLNPSVGVFHTGSARMVWPSSLMIVRDAYFATPRCSW
jgi:hypothetical protein